MLSVNSNFWYFDMDFSNFGLLNATGLTSDGIKAEADGYVPLKTRLLAWWEGVGVEDINDLKASAVAITTDQMNSENPLEWDDQRLAVSQTIWGESFLKPGGPAFAREILKSAKVTSKDTVLDLTAGMCGTAMVLASQHNLWMEAFEQNQSVVAKAHNMLVTKGMAKKIKLTHQPLNELKLDPKKYDLIYSRENLYKEEAKVKIIEEVKKGLKKNGRFIFTDFINVNKTNDEEAVSKYFELNPWTMEQYLVALKNADLNVFAHTDMSNQYLKHINHAWYEMIGKIEDTSHTKEFVNKLMNEGSVWLSRHKAIQSGKIRLMRYHCFKTD